MAYAANDNVDQHRARNVHFWFYWLFANASGAVVGWSLSAMAIMFTLGIGAIVSGVFVGVFIGASQGFVLEQYCGEKGRGSLLASWTLLSTLGSTVAWLIIGMGKTWSSFLDPASNPQNAFDIWDRPLVWIGLLSLAGALIGLLQQTALPGRRHIITSWIVFNVLGLCIGGFIGVSAGDAVYRAIAPEAFSVGSNVERYMFSVQAGTGAALDAVLPRMVELPRAEPSCVTPAGGSLGPRDRRGT